MRSMLWYVAFGSAAGGVARYLVGTVIQFRTATPFPWGTLAINVSRSPLLLAFLLRHTLQTPTITPEIRALLSTGFCGGYTTFSTFSYETVNLIESREYRWAALYIALSVAVSLAGTFGGIALARETLALRRVT